MKRSKRYNSKLGKLFFVLPVLIIAGLVVYGFAELNSPGTLIIRAETPDGTALQVSVTANGQAGTTPWTLSLRQGTYPVNFTSLSWYYPPSDREVSISPSTTSYAVAIYYPIGRVISVSPNGFNATVVTALHGVTPVNWTNPSNAAVSFQGDILGRVVLEPGQSISYTFTSAGVYNYTVLSTDYTVSVRVS